METLRKTNLILPDEAVATLERLAATPDKRNQYLTALREARWTYQSMAEATGLTRERIRQIVAKVQQDHGQDMALSVPVPPSKPTRQPAQYNEPDPGVLARLTALQPMAQQARGDGSKHYAESIEYSRLIWEQHTIKGVPLYRLALRLGVTHGALRFRLQRHKDQLTEKV